VPPRKHLKQGNVYLGSPARLKDKAIELELSSTRIPMMRKNLFALMQRMAKLSERMERFDQIKEEV
jgi:UDP-3-O-[3-hydroxymyristoyl] glucosamine N-acyltransferase